MSRPMHAETILRYLWGQLQGKELSGFYSMVSDNTTLRADLEKETACEALFYSMSWDIQTAPGLETAADWASLEARVPSTGKGTGTDTADVLEWNAAVDKAFETAFPVPDKKGKQSRLFPFPKVFRYLAAACIVAAIAGTILLRPLDRNSSAPVAYVDSTRTVVGEENHGTTDTTRKPAPITSFAFDSIVIYSPRSFAGKPILTETRDGIVRIGEKSAILVDKNSSVAVTSQSDSAVSIDLTSGSALFTVEKHRFNRFNVATPAGNIAVTGTIFRLAVEKKQTIVSVLEGSVQASRRYDTAMVSICAGMSARIMADTIMLENGDTAATLLFRSNILREFLRENGVFENGMFVRSGIMNKNDTGERVFDVKQTVSGESRKP